MASDIEKILTEKGPGNIPAWGYGVGLAGAVLAWEWFRNRQSAQQTPQAPGTGTNAPATTSTTVRTSPVSPWHPPWSWRPGWRYGVPPPSNNWQWKRQAYDFLVSRGDDPVSANTALTRFVNRRTLNAEQAAMVRMAREGIGAEPEPLPLLTTPTFVSTGGPKQNAAQSTTTAEATHPAATAPGDQPLHARVEIF